MSKVTAWIWQKLKWITLLLALLCYAATLLIASFYSGSFGNRIDQQKLQKGVDQLQVQMQNIADQLETLPENFSFFNQSYLDLMAENPISVFVYQQDSLIAWTNNEYQVEAAFDYQKPRIINASHAFLLVRDFKLAHHRLRLSCPILANYKIENEYIQNKLNPLFSIDRPVSFSTNLKAFPLLLDTRGEAMIGVKWQAYPLDNTQQNTMVFFLYLLAFILSLVFARSLLNAISLPSILRIVLLWTFIFGFLWFQKLVFTPSILLNGPIFSPTTFASSLLFSSLGEFILASFAGLFALISLHDYLKDFASLRWKNRYWQAVVYGGFLISIFFVLLLLKGMVADLVFHSTISYNLLLISDFNYLTLIGLISLSVWIFGFYQLFVRLDYLLYADTFTPKMKYTILAIVLLVVGLLTFFILSDHYYTFLFFGLFLLSNQWIKQGKILHRFSVNILYLLAISLLLSYWLTTFNLDNEHNKRIGLVKNIATDQDPQAEYFYTDIATKIYSDTSLLKMFYQSEVNFDSIGLYIEEHYFRKYSHFDQYDLQTTICSQDMKLMIQPQNTEIICDSFFYYNLIRFGSLTSNKNLYRLNYGTGQINYLGLLRFLQTITDKPLVYTVYIEINSKLKRKGFTRLLSAKGNDPFEKIANYSLALYEENERIESYGSYRFPEHYHWQKMDKSDFRFMEQGGYDHLIYRASKNQLYVLSLQMPSFFNKLSSFSYLFVLYGLIFFIFLNLISLNPHNPLWQRSFAGRMQVVMTSIILSSFVAITLITLFYFRKLNDNKNNSHLEALAKSLQTEFEHKFEKEDGLRKLDVGVINKLIGRFSSVFDTDINIYNPQGRLIASTRNEVFDYPLISRLMNPQAFLSLKEEHQGLFITKENIGTLVYSSAYIPFHNEDGRVVAFINLPHFAHEELLKSESSSWMATLMNVYTLIFVLAILTILLVSNYLSRSLNVLKKHLHEVGLGKTNQKIKWKGIDEINTLVEEYNKMLDELALSSEKLAKSERESAWREMAKQVAHEIKNPLTPMKLSVQYMLHSFNQNADFSKERMQSLANTLIEQIDTLSDIATAFSDFAEMPKSTVELQDLNAIVQSSVALFQEEKDLHISLILAENAQVLIDKNQWLRVFNNLIKNSLQAKAETRDLELKIELQNRDNHLFIRFTDNGKGISDDLKPMIFVPKFTTKTKGAGLGLAMVKNIVTNANGTIHFESTMDIGTSFIIELPLPKL
jgi:signal transduction histidine kinase